MQEGEPIRPSRGPETLTPDEELAADALPKPPGVADEEGEGDEWVQTGKSPEETPEE